MRSDRVSFSFQNIAHVASRASADVNAESAKAGTGLTEPSAHQGANRLTPSERYRQPASSRMQGLLRKMFTGSNNGAEQAKGPLGDKSFGVASAALAEGMGKLKLDPSERARISQFVETGSRLDAELLRCAHSKTVSPEIGQLRREWRALFAQVYEIADDHERGGTEDEEKKPAAGFKRAPDPTWYVFKGGGPKGQAYFGALALCQALGKDRPVTAYSGSSVGAITAGMAACGGGFADLGEASLVEDMSKIMFSKADRATSKIAEYETEFGLTMGQTPLLSKGEGFIDYLDTTLTSTVVKRLDMLESTLRDELQNPGKRDDATGATDLEHRQRMCHEKLGAIEILKSTIKDDTVRFEHLPALSQHFPEHFKNLYVSAYDVGRDEMIYFNSKDPKYARVPLSLAIRASASLPVAFKSIKMNIDDVDRKLIDGGVRTNIPLETINLENAERYLQHLQDGEDAPAKGKTKEDDGALTLGRHHARTLAFVFHQDGDEYTKLHSRPKKVAKVTAEGWLPRLASRNSSLTNDRMADAQKIRDLGPNTVVLSHGKLTTTSFKADAFSRMVAQMEGEFDMAQHYALRLQQAEFIG